MLAMLTMRCESQESPPVEKPAEGAGTFELLQLAQVPAQVKITINRSQGTIKAVPPHVDICRTENVCPEDQFLWFIPGGLKDGERLVIRGARDVCFNWPNGELEILYPINGAQSGPFLSACLAADKYGFYWPYIIELFEGDDLEPIAETDPSGIFRR
jgi:hypothetical protein